MAFGPVKPLPRASARPQAKAQKQKQAKAHAQAQAQAQAQATPKAGPSTLSNTAQDSDATTILPPPPLLALAAVAGRLFGTATAAERRSAAWKAMVQKRRVELAKRVAGAVPAVYLDAPHAHDGNTTTTNAATDVTAPGATMPTTRRSGLRSGSSSASIESAGANASSVPNETRSGYATRLTKAQSYLLNKVFESITPFPLDEWIYIMAIASGRCALFPLPSYLVCQCTIIYRCSCQIY